MGRSPYWCGAAVPRCQGRLSLCPVYSPIRHCDFFGANGHRRERQLAECSFLHRFYVRRRRADHRHRFGPLPTESGQPAAPPSCALESAILITLNPGAYTIHLSGVNGGTGVGLIEVFEADSGATSELVNLSTRSPVQIGDNVVIGGFVIDGNTPKTVLVRGRGPSMSGAPFFVPGALANPTLRLFSGQAVIAQNDNWQDASSCAGFVCGGAGQIAATGLDPCQPNPGQPSAPPNCALESAI